MKNTLPLFLLVLVFSLACEKEDIEIPTCENCSFTCLEASEAEVITNDCMDNWDCAFTVSADSKVATGEMEGRTSGRKNVFQMINSTLGTAIIDDELTDVLVFELDKSQNSFSVEGIEMKGMKVHFRRLCYCGETEFKAVTSGCMQGEKQSDGSWLVQGHLTVPYSSKDREVKFDAQFF
ncbi:hypothetical protein [uncultured Imperialibacter sp.]|uniref:hypothetical protein n=1 Tax=uncultured Imperialibacter sp. TaxID=1672639 RepID=UPI0030DB20A0|tara:strand:+ start:26843 stop:27379 length:537 start_codon:yes stop_codon:yes gene_type:complete